MFECMDIAKPIYKGVVEPYTEKLTREDTNHAGNSSKMRVRDASEKTNPEMGRDGNCNTRYV